MSSISLFDKADASATAITRARYQRLAPLYDVMEWMAERQHQPWRLKLWSLVRGPKVLEVGVGTGKNLPYYPPGLEITAIDLTPGMLVRAQKRAAALNVPVDLRLGDVQSLDFPTAHFDSGIATFVFCSVPDPVLGLAELRRVVKSGGQVLLLEHMRPADPKISHILDYLNPVVVRLMGANINRPTLTNIQKAGLIIERVESLDRLGIFKLIEASVP